jgi:hypothetical protein
MDNVAYVTRTYSRLAEVITKYSKVSTGPRYVVMTRRTMDMQSLSYDRDCPQVNLVLRERVHDSHHPMGEYLPSYLDIDVSL